LLGYPPTYTATSRRKSLDPLRNFLPSSCCRWRSIPQRATILFKRRSNFN